MASKSSFELAVEERYRLQQREKEKRANELLQVEHEHVVAEWLAARQQGRNMQPASEETAKTCEARGGCSWPEAMAVLFAAHSAGAPPVMHSMTPAEQWLKPTVEMNTSKPHVGGVSCQRMRGDFLSPADFMAFVHNSQPVVLEGLLSNWSALSNKWDMDYLLQRVGNSTVKVYASPDGTFESVVRASDPIAPSGQPACTGCAPSDLVLLRPAETEMSFEQFWNLVDRRGLFADRRAKLAHLYLQKHPLRRWQHLAAEAAPRPHELIAPWLRLEHELLWLAAEGQCTRGSQ